MDSGAVYSRQHRNASTICEFFQCGAKTQASASRQGGAEHLGAVVCKGPRKPGGDFPARKQRTDEKIRKGRVLIGGQIALPGSIPDGVGADRPEIGASAENHAVAEDNHAIIAASYAVEHMDVNGI